MPGPIVHLHVQQHLHHFLEDSRNLEYYRLLKDDLCSPYTGFGSIGPDFLFFSMREYGDKPQEFINFLFKIFDALEPFVEFYEKHIEPVQESIEDVENWVDEKVFHGLFGELREAAKTMIAAFFVGPMAEISKHLDFFINFYPKIQEGAPENEWYWFDFLHYRRTGDFCSNMWILAQGDDDLKRYCLGYASHIGTDVVGHPFVNAIVGGPYRTHWHRHKLVENWIDAYTRNFYYERVDPIYRKCLKLTEKDKYAPKSISGSYLSRLCEFEDGKMPKKLGNMFISALNSTYSDISHPRKLSVTDLDSTYRLWLLWFKRATEIGLATKPTPVDPPGERTADLLKDFLSGLPSYPNKDSGDGGGSFSMKNIFKELDDFIRFISDVVIYIIDWVLKHIVDIVTIGYWEGIQLLRFAVYQIHKAIYELYDNFRFTLVLGGYLFPEEGDLEKHPWGKTFVNTSFVDLTGGNKPSFFNYPLKQEPHNIFTPEHHLEYPVAFQEFPHAEPAPKPFFGQFPEFFITEAQKNSDSFNLYRCIAPYGDGDQYTHSVGQKTWDTTQLGSAIQCSADLIISSGMQEIPNFNLDGDRGYGWKTWRAIHPEQIDDLSTVDVNYID